MHDPFAGYLTVIVITLVIYYFSTAFLTGWLAEKKGYNSVLWGIFGFFFGFIALLTVGFAPNYFGSKKEEIKVNESEVLCGTCGNKVKRQAGIKFCSTCGTNLSI